MRAVEEHDTEGKERQERFPSRFCRLLWFVAVQPRLEASELGQQPLPLLRRRRTLDVPVGRSFSSTE